MSMRRLLPLLLLPTACHYGYVYDARTGQPLDGARVRIQTGRCAGTGCSSATSGQDLTNSSGLWRFDGYGDFEGEDNVIFPTPRTGDEAVGLNFWKSGYQSQTVRHKSDFEHVTYNGKAYKRSEVQSVYLCRTGSADSDGDGLCNEAEARYGTDPNNPDTDGDGFSDRAEVLGYESVDLRYHGADPLHRDIFLEVDWFPGLRPSDEAIALVVEAFANAPLSNPDGTSGIRLHVDMDDQIRSADVDLNLSPVWTDYDVIKNKYFSPARRRVFRYVLFAHRYDGGQSSGKARGIPHRDFLVTLGGWPTPGGTVAQQAGTLMHELGHTLGLGHGGQDSQNYKPHYLSIMSYNYQVAGLRRDGAMTFDYSRTRVAGLNEASLNEANAFSPGPGANNFELASYGVRIYLGNRNYQWLSGNAGTNLDMNRNGTIQWTQQSIDLNGNGNTNDGWGTTQNDWDNLVYHGDFALGDIGAGAGFARAAPPVRYRVAEADMPDCATP